MPELPEVETMRRGIQPIVGQRIKDIQLAECLLRPIQSLPTFSTIQKKAIGKQVTSVDRVGKRVVVRLDDGSGLVFEPRMTGLLLVADAPDREHLRMRVDLKGGPLRRFWFWDRRGLGVVRWLNAKMLEAKLGPESIGPDALECTVHQWRSRLGSSRRAIKVALLDQKVAAGIGNLYAAEILHVARIHPAKTCNSLRLADWTRLQKATVEILSQAIEHEGSTLSDETYRTALNKNGSYQNLHRVYGMQGKTCGTCGRGTIQRIVQAQRATFFCPHCQKRS